MFHYEDEHTIPLWGEENGKKITLREKNSGRLYSFQLKKQYVIGRNPSACDQQVNPQDRFISGRHLCFMYDFGTVYVADMHSTNGSWLNGRRLTVKEKLHSGDLLRIGRSEFQVRF
ncbi:MAG: FHA domain-containing protein [Lachnospiraceae bacterium]|nr:FHA domain-containing protein [Lachnospiraceae bacterium]